MNALAQTVTGVVGVNIPERGLVLLALSAIGAVGLWLSLIPPVATNTPIGITRRAVRAGVVGVTVAVTVGLASGWIFTAIIAGAAAGLVMADASSMQRRHPSNGPAAIARLEAVATWIESLRDLMGAGEQPIGAVTVSVPAAPEVIRPAVQRLARSLAHESPTLACHAFADDIDDPVGDVCAMGLALAIERGARTARVFDALAAQTRQAVERRRLVEAERAPVRREVSLLVALMLALFAAVLLSGRSGYLAAYGTLTGQVVLACAVAVFAGLIVRTRSLAAFPRPARVLVAVTHAERAIASTGGESWT